MREITYSQNGEYQIPDISLEETRGTIGKYGLMRKEYLRNHKVARFNILTLQNRLDSHLMEIDSQARQRVDNLMSELLEKTRHRTNGRRDGMDQTHEPDQSTGRGTGNSGDYLQLSLFPTEEEQLGEIRKAVAALEQPAAFLISDEVVDDILRTGSGQKNTLFHITARLIEGLDNEEMQNFLKEEYETGGKGFTIDGQKISIWYDNDGIRIRRGDSARRNFDRMVTWEEAADRIRDMYEDRSYVDNLISNNAIEQEQEEMTNLLALHFRDTSRNREEQQSYSDWQDVVREAWTDSAEADAIAHRFEWLQKDMDENPEDYRRWEIQHNPEYFQRFQDLQRERSWVDQKFTVERPALSFITQDEIDAVLRRGGITAGGRNRIYEYFMEHHDIKDAAEFLKMSMVQVEQHLGYRERMNPMLPMMRKD